MRVSPPQEVSSSPLPFQKPVMWWTVSVPRSERICTTRSSHLSLFAGFGCGSPVMITASYSRPTSRTICRMPWKLVSCSIRLRRSSHRVAFPVKRDQSTRTLPSFGGRWIPRPSSQEPILPSCASVMPQASRTVFRNPSEKT